MKCVFQVIKKSGGDEHKDRQFVGRGFESTGAKGISDGLCPRVYVRPAVLPGQRHVLVLPRESDL